MRVDIFGVREDGDIGGHLIAPLRPEVPTLVPGRTYLLEVVVRTVKMGHTFTQGTTDSNQIWLDVAATAGGKTIGANGAMNPGSGIVDPWAHYLGAFVLNRNGDRINRRNVHEIFTPLYSHQIPPGAADTVHYRLTVPEDATGSIDVAVKLRYRKFETEYIRLIKDDPEWVNDLPILELAEDTLTFPVGAAGTPSVESGESAIPTWQRWNDFGIGLLRKAGGAQLRQAEEAFKEVEALGRPDGPLNLARVYLAEGRVDKDAPDALRRAQGFTPPAREWSVLWFTGLVNKQNGRLDEAISNFEQIVEGGFAQAKGRGFDFSKDWRVLNELGETVFERARQERGEARRAAREDLLNQAAAWFQRTLELDPEDAAAHYGLSQVFADLGQDDAAQKHADQHAKYKVDDNARDVAVAKARASYPAADVASEAVVIYDLHRAASAAPREPK